MISDTDHYLWKNGQVYNKQRAPKLLKSSMKTLFRQNVNFAKGIIYLDSGYLGAHNKETAQYTHYTRNASECCYNSYNLKVHGCS